MLEWPLTSHLWAEVSTRKGKHFPGACFCQRNPKHLTEVFVLLLLGLLPNLQINFLRLQYFLSSIVEEAGIYFLVLNPDM